MRSHFGPGSLFVIVVTDLERDLEMERRKSASLQDTLKEHEKEYQKLKVATTDIQPCRLLTPS